MGGGQYGHTPEECIAACGSRPRHWRLLLLQELHEWHMLEAARAAHGPAAPLRKFDNDCAKLQLPEAESRAKSLAWEGLVREGVLRAAVLSNRRFEVSVRVRGNKVLGSMWQVYWGRGRSNGQLGGGRIPVEVEAVNFPDARGALGPWVVAARSPGGGKGFWSGTYRP